MSRAHINYSARTPVVRTFEGFNPDTPVEGYYGTRLRSGAAYVGVHLWFGRPVEPWTGEEMDRAPRWNAAINDRWHEVGAVWPKCADEPVTEAEYRHLCATQAWAQQHAPESALAQPTRKFDPLTSPLLF